MSRTPQGFRHGRKRRRFRPSVQSLESRELLTVTLNDGGFEYIVVGNGNFAYAPSGSPWTFGGAAGVTGNNSAFASGGQVAPDGQQAGFIQQSGSISQQVPGWTSGSYHVTFAASQRYGSDQDFQVLVDGSVVATFQPQTSTSYLYYTTPAFTVADGDHTVTLQGIDSSGGDNVVLVDSVVVVPATPGVPVVNDPSFEQAPVAPGSYAYNPQDSYWDFRGSAGVSGDNSIFTSANPSSPDGTHVAFIQGGSSLIQTVVDWSTGNYQVSLSVAQSGLGDQSGEGIQVLLDGAVVGSVMPSSTTYQVYTTPNFPVTAGSHALSFRGLDPSGKGNTVLMDGVGVAQVSGQSDTAPAAPSGLAATTVSSSEIDLTWNASIGASVYSIERSLDGSTNWFPIAHPSGTSTSFADTGLSEGTTYYYRILASNGIQESAYTPTVSDSTLLANPTGLTATLLSPSDVALNWTDNSAIEAGYSIEQSSDGFSGWSVVGIAPPNATTFAASGPFVAAATYHFRVRATAPADASAYSTPAEVDTPGLPATPVIASLAAVSAASVALAWSGVQGAEGYRVERSSDSGATWSLDGIVDAGTTAFTDASVQPAMTYSYRVVALGDFGESMPSDARSLTINPSAPAELFASASGVSSILLFWSAVPGATGYSVERSGDGATGWSPIGSLAAGTVNYVDANLASSTAYYYRVKVSGAAGDSGYSPVASATTTVTMATPDVASIVAIDPQASQAGQDPAVFRVSRTGDLSKSLIVYLVPGGTASDGGFGDYTSVGMSQINYPNPAPYRYAIIPAGSSYQDITITPNDSSRPGPDRTVILSLLPDGINYSLDSRSAATAVITADRAAVNVVSLVATDSQGDFSGQGSVTFRVSRTGDLSNSLGVGLHLGGNLFYYSSSGITRNGNSNPLSESYVTIPAGASYQDVTIIPSQNSQPGPDELVVLAIVPDPGFYAIAAQSAATALISGETPATPANLVSIAATSPQASEAGQVPATFRVSRTGSLDQPLAVYLNLGGSASYNTGNDDYTVSPTLQQSGNIYSNYTLTIPAGADHQDFSITPIDDTLAEGDETVAASLLGLSNAYGLAGNTTATATIADDLAAVNTATIAATNPVARQIGLEPATFRVSRTGSLNNPLRVYLNLGGTAAYNSDYETSSSLVPTLDPAGNYAVTIPAGSAYQDVTITPDANAHIAGEKMVNAALVGRPGDTYGLADIASATATIVGATPVTPTNLTAALVTASQVNLSWSGVTSAMGYDVERSTNAGATWTRISSTGADVTSYSDTNVLDGTQDSYRVVAFGIGGLSTPSGTATVTIPLAAPGAFSARFVSGSRIDLGWADLSSTETGYDVEQSSDGTTGWATLAYLPANSTGYSVSKTFNPTTPYYFRVRAFSTGSGFESPYATGGLTTPSFPDPPTGVAVTEGTLPSSVGLLVTWSPTTGAIGYVVERTSNPPNGWTQIARVTGGGAAYSDSGLNDRTTYYYRLLADNGIGLSRYSAIGFATAYATPGIVTPATVENSTISGKSANLSGLGSAPGGEQTLTYAWSVVSEPANTVAPNFSPNGTNAAKQATAIFAKAGSYVLRLTISNGSASTTSDIAVSVSQSVSSVSIGPSVARIAPGATQQFTAAELDQFGQSITTSDPVAWSLPAGTPGSIDANGLYTAPNNLDLSSITIDASIDGISTSIQATVTDKVTINFEQFPVGTTITDQYGIAVFLTDPGQYNAVVSDWAPHAIGTFPLSKNNFDRNLYVDFKQPVRDLTFDYGYDDSAGKIGEVRVYRDGPNGQIETTVPIIGAGNVSVGTVDLSKFINVTRIEIVNITDPAGLVYDNFSFVPGPSVLLTWDSDDNADTLHVYVVDLNEGDVTPKLFDDKYDPTVDSLGNASYGVDWGDTTPPDDPVPLEDGSVPHFYDQVQHTIIIYSSLDGSPVTSTFNLEIGHTPNQVVTTDAPDPKSFQEIDWTQVDGAVDYRIYRGLLSDGSDGTLLASVASPGYSDETADPGTSYYYHIVADITDGTTLDYGVLDGGSGDTGGITAAAVGTPSVMRFGTATQADAQIEVVKLYQNAPAEAAKTQGVYISLRDVRVIGRDQQLLNNTVHLVASLAKTDTVPNVRQQDTGVYLAGGGTAAAEVALRKIASDNRSSVRSLGGGQFTTTTQDGTVLTSQPDGVWGKLFFQRPGEGQNLIRYSGVPIRELGIRNSDGANNSIDRIDNLNVIVEEKDGRGQEDPVNKNPDGTLIFSDIKWSSKYIYYKMDRRLALLLGVTADSRVTPYKAAGQTFKSPPLIAPYVGPDDLPTANDVRSIKRIKFECKGNTATFQSAVNADVDRLRNKYAQYGYTFEVQFGGS